MWYVSPSGSDSNDGKKRGTAFKTIQKAADLTEPGDVVIVRDGIYTVPKGDFALTISRSGTAGKWITFRSENRHGAVIDGRDLATRYGILLKAPVSFIRIEGFEIRNFRSMGIFAGGYNQEGVGSHDIVIKNNHIHHIARMIVRDCKDAYGRTGVFTGPCSARYLFEGNTLNDIGRIPNPECDKLPEAENHNYRHDQGLYLQGYMHVVKNNLFYNHPAGWAIKLDGHYSLKDEIGTDHCFVISGNTFLPTVTPYVGGFIRFFNNRTASRQWGNMKAPRNILIEKNKFYKPEGTKQVSAIRISDNRNSNFEGTVIRKNMTTSKFMYSENLGENITGNITAAGNRLNVPESKFKIKISK
jgi:hypothetical protein